MKAIFDFIYLISFGKPTLAVMSICSTSTNIVRYSSSSNMESKHGERQEEKEDDDDERSEVTFSSSTTVLASNKTTARTINMRTSDINSLQKKIDTIFQNPTIRKNLNVREYIRETADIARTFSTPFMEKMYIRLRFYRLRSFTLSKSFRLEKNLVQDLSSLSPDGLDQVGKEPTSFLPLLRHEVPFFSSSTTISEGGGPNLSSSLAFSRGGHGENSIFALANDSQPSMLFTIMEESSADEQMAGEEDIEMTVSPPRRQQEGFPLQRSENLSSSLTQAMIHGMNLFQENRRDTHTADCSSSDDTPEGI